MKKTILITGFSGFVARHFYEYLLNKKINIRVVGIDIREPNWKYTEYKNALDTVFYKVNLLDYSGIQQIIDKEFPEYILHLAAFSSVSYSWEHPEESFMNNSNIFINLIQAVKQNNPNCRILSIGSSEEYGIVSEDNIPVTENCPVSPISPYAVARVSQEMLSKIYVDSYGLNIIMTRSFNHIGPGQEPRFVVPGFIERILNIKNQGNKFGKIETGNLEIIRDFVDVRDVVEAYWMLLENGKVGEIYNICSGKGLKLLDIVDIIGKDLGVQVKTVVNDDYIRPNDNMIIIGSYDKIYNQFGWRPHRKIEDTIKDMIESRLRERR